MVSRSRSCAFLFLIVAILWVLFAAPATAKPPGGEPLPGSCCPTCSQATPDSPGGTGPCNSRDGGACGCGHSYSMGKTGETYPVFSAAAANGTGLDLALHYASYNADGEKAVINTVLGYGWSHSYNVFLFQQDNDLFKMSPAGLTTKYQRSGRRGQLRATRGHQQSIVENSDGSIEIRNNDGLTFRFERIPGNPLRVEGTEPWMLKRITDRNGNQTELSYLNGLLERVEDTYGRQASFQYDVANRLIRIIDPAHRATEFSYDGFNNLAGVVDPLGQQTTYQYNARHQIARKTDRNGRQWHYEYDADARPTGLVDANGDRLFSMINSSGWATDQNQLFLNKQRVYVPSTTTLTDGRSLQWHYEYNGNGLITRVVAPDGATTTYTYDAATLNVATETDANGHTTRFEYDARGNLITDTNALGHVTAYEYEPVFNMMTRITDPNGRVTTFQYDAFGNRIRETDPLGQTQEWTYDANGNVLTEQDKNGNVTTHQYDSLGNRIQTIDALGNVTRMSYDVMGNLLSRTDANGRTTGFNYDVLDRLIVEIDPAGQMTRFFYDGVGNRTRVIDRNGNATSFQYDARDRLESTTDALNQANTQAYDGNDNRVTMTNKNGHATTFQYDVQNRLEKTTDAEGFMSTRGYDPVGNVLVECDANNHCTTYTYDELNRRVTALDAEGNLTRFFYDTVGTPVCAECTGPTPGSSLVTQQTDANGKVTHFKYDGLDRLVRQIRKQTDTTDSIDADDAVTRHTYDPHGNRRTLTEPNGNTTEFVYDGLHRLVQEVNAAGDTTLTEYDGVGNVIRVTAPNGNVTENTYDNLDRLTNVRDGVGQVVRFAYDAEGNQLTGTDGNGNTTTNAYDAIYRLVQVSDALGQPTRYEYDPVGNLIRLTDREGIITTHEYDDINRRIRTTDAQPFVTEYGYDAVGNLTTITAFNDPSPPQLTSYANDRLNRLVQETYPDGGVRRFSYDGVGNILTRTDQQGQVTQYQYSDLYFLRRRTYPLSPADVMTYDLSGRMLSAERGGWLVTFDYDGANRVIETTQDGKTVTYVYDIPARTRTVMYPGSRTITETTDPRARLARIDDDVAPSLVEYVYDLGNRVTTRGYRNGVTATYGYNANNWITSLEHTRGATLIAGFRHDYDNEGNKRFEEKAHDPNRSEAYQYDDVYRLIDFTVGDLVGATVPMPLTQTQYDLDRVGNWDAKTTDGVTEIRIHNQVNEITAINGVPIFHDDNGNLAEDERYTYAYDEQNRLTHVTRKSDGKVVGQYQYDALSRRIVKIADPEFGSSFPVETRYFYDAARIVEEQDPATTTLATYIYGTYVDEVLTMDRSRQTFYYHQQSLWSVAAVTDAVGNVAERYHYDAYGLPVITDGAGAAIFDNPWGTPHSAIGNPWMFTGRQFDEETGIYFYRERYYDPVKGRFLQRDPLEYMEGINLYEYVQGRVITLVDPYGLKKIWGWEKNDGVSVKEEPSKFWGPYLESEDKGLITHWWGTYGIEMTRVDKDCGTDTIKASGNASSSYYTSPLFGLPLGHKYLYASEEGSVTVKCDRDSGNVTIVAVDGKRETEKKIVASVLVQTKIEDKKAMMSVDVKTGYAETIKKTVSHGWKFNVERRGVKGEYSWGTTVEIDESGGKTWGENKSRLYKCLCCEVP